MPPVAPGTLSLSLSSSSVLCTYLPTAAYKDVLDRRRAHSPAGCNFSLILLFVYRTKKLDASSGGGVSPDLKPQRRKKGAASKTIWRRRRRSRQGKEIFRADSRNRGGRDAAMLPASRQAGTVL
jgi:hypothetical protein